MIWIGIDCWAGISSAYSFAGTLVGLCVAHLVFIRMLRLFEPWKSGKTIDDNLVWFTMHALANAVIVFYAFQDTLHVLANPLEAFSDSACLTQVCERENENWSYESRLRRTLWLSHYLHLSRPTHADR